MSSRWRTTSLAELHSSKAVAELPYDAPYTDRRKAYVRNATLTARRGGVNGGVPMSSLHPGSPKAQRTMTSGTEIHLGSKLMPQAALNKYTDEQITHQLSATMDQTVQSSYQEMNNFHQKKQRELYVTAQQLDKAGTSRHIALGGTTYLHGPPTERTVDQILVDEFKSGVHGAEHALPTSRADRALAPEQRAAKMAAYNRRDEKGRLVYPWDAARGDHNVLDVCSGYRYARVDRTTSDEFGSFGNGAIFSARKEKWANTLKDKAFATTAPMKDQLRESRLQSTMDWPPAPMSEYRRTHLPSARKTARGGDETPGRLAERRNNVLKVAGKRDGKGGGFLKPRLAGDVCTQIGHFYADSGDTRFLGARAAGGIAQTFSAGAEQDYLERRMDIGGNDLRDMRSGIQGTIGPDLRHFQQRGGPGQTSRLRGFNDGNPAMRGAPGLSEVPP